MAGNPSANADALDWIGGANGAWNAGASWRDLTTNTTIAVPGALTPASITTAAPAVITGGGIAGSLAVQGAVRLAGTYAIGAITLGAAIAATTSLPFNTTIAGDLTLDAGDSLATTGPITLIAGTLALNAGATLTASGAIDELAGVITAAGALTAFVDSATVTLGDAISIFAPSLGASDGAIIQAGDIVTTSGGSVILAVDRASAIEVGMAGGAARGAVTVDAGATLSIATSTVIDGNLVANGAVILSAGTFDVSGSIVGTGTLSIGAGATLLATGLIGAGVDITFDSPGATLEIAPGADVAATLEAAGTYAGDSFRTSPMTNGGSAITLLAGGGFPSALTPVTLTGTSDTIFDVITGNGSAASLLVLGLVAFTGTIQTGALTIGTTTAETLAGVVTTIDQSGSLLLTGTADLDATSMDLVDGGIAIESARLIIEGSLTLGGNLTVSTSGTVQVGSLIMGAGGTLATDATSAIEIGFTGTSTPGTLTIDAGRSVIVDASTTLATPLIDNGTLAIAAGTVTLDGIITGTGAVLIEPGTDLVTSSEIRVALTFAGAGGTLTISPDATLDGAIAGFIAGDQITLAGLTADTARQSGGQLVVSHAGTVVANLLLASTADLGHFIVSTSAAGATIADLPPPATAVAADFSGDGHSAILWQNTNGAPAIWLMNGLTPTATQQLANPGPTWHVVTSGDFTADGDSGLLWQNDDGTVAIWSLQGLTPISYGEVADPGPSWHVIGTGDLNGDGRADILFQNDNGAPAIWEMQGNSIIASAQLANPGPSWHVTGTGDFNGDGYSDILWRNDDGTVAIWDMNGLTPIATADVANPGPAWRIVASGDFTGGPCSDILFQNDDGTLAIWEIQGFSIVASAELGNPGAQWHAVGTGDYNGDGDADILFQNDSGAVAIWEMNGLAPIATALVANVPLSWQTIGAGDIHFINATVSSGTLDATIMSDDFIFTSAVAGTHVIAGFDPVEDLITLSAARFGSYAGLAADTTLSGGSMRLDLGGGATLALQGIISLQAKNFVFS